MPRMNPDLPNRAEAIQQIIEYLRAMSDAKNAVGAFESNPAPRKPATAGVEADER